MKNQKLKKEFTDEKTNNISYTLVGDYYFPNIVAKKEKRITLNKYGIARLNYLKDYRNAYYTTLLMNGSLNKHLNELQVTAKNLVDKIIDDLKDKSDLTEEMKNTNPSYWVGTMNAIKNQAEEIVFKELIYA